MKKKFRNISKHLGLVALGTITLSTTVNAGGLQGSQLVQGFNNLLKDAATAGIFLESGVLIFLEIKEGIALQGAAIEEAPKHKKKMISMAGVGALVICVTALVPIFFSYFQ